MDIPLTVAIAADLPKSTLPQDPAAIASHQLLQGLELAHPGFGGEIDLIIGTSYLPLFWTETGRRFDVDARLTTISTVFGWTVADPIPHSEIIVTLKVELVEDVELSQAFNKLYELDQVPQANWLTPKGRSAMEQLNQSVNQHPDGYYAAILPIVGNSPELGKSKQMAISRLLFNERKMKAAGK